MKNVLYITAALFLTGWGIGFFLLGAGTLIHSLAVFAMIFYLQGVIKTPKPQE
jgi:Family of unknown function (DUF5670)